MFKRKKHVAILGAGPSGMFAAHAFGDAGWDVIIYSKRGQSQMFGAQYLHAPIPGLPERRIEVDYQLEGSVEGYRDKVYGPSLPGAVQASPQTLIGTHPAWDIRAAYWEAYDRYEHRIIPCDVGPGNVDDLLKGNVKYIFSTIPLPAICRDKESHQFHATEIWAAGDAPELGRMCPISCPPSTVICSGNPERAWYRVSNVFGHTTAEWPGDRKPPLNGLGHVQKPLYHNCNCWEGTRLRPAGRYGAWQKGILTHHVYQYAKELAGGK